MNPSSEIAERNDSLLVIGENKQLVIPEDISSITLADFMPVMPQLQVLNASMVFDYRDKKGNIAARSHVAGLRKMRAPIKEVHKRDKATLKAMVDEMDARKKSLEAIVDEMIEVHASVLRTVAEEEEAAAEKARIAKEISDNLDLAYEMNSMFDQQRALDAQAEEQQRKEEEQAEAQRKIDQANRENEIARQAAEDARLIEANRAERDKRESEERERKANEAHQAALKAAEAKVAKAKEDAAAEIEAQAKAKREADAKIAADDANRRAINRSILAAIMKHGIEESVAIELLFDLVEGTVDYVSVDYTKTFIPEGEL